MQFIFCLLSVVPLQDLQSYAITNQILYENLFVLNQKVIFFIYINETNSQGKYWTISFSGSTSDLYLGGSWFYIMALAVLIDALSGIPHSL
jgi:hypothetical protein